MKTVKIPIGFFTHLSKRARNSAYKVMLDMYIEIVQMTGEDIRIILTKNPPKRKKESEDAFLAMMRIKKELGSMTEQDWDNLGEWLQEKYDNLPEDKKLFSEEREQKEIAEMWQNVNTK